MINLDILTLRLGVHVGCTVGRTTKNMRIFLQIRKSQANFDADFWGLKSVSPPFFFDPSVFFAFFACFFSFLDNKTTYIKLCVSIYNYFVFIYWWDRYKSI